VKSSEVRAQVESSELYVAFVICSEELMKSILELTSCLATSRLRAAGFVGEHARKGEDEMDFAIVTGGGISGTPTLSFDSPTAEAFEEFVTVFAFEWADSPAAVCIIVGDSDATFQTVMSSYVKVTSL